MTYLVLYLAFLVGVLVGLLLPIVALGWILSKPLRLPVAEKTPADECRACRDADCLGPDVAANRGGCRMHTWADVG